MPKFIIKIDNNHQDLIKKDNIVCYLIDSSLDPDRLSSVTDFAHQNQIMILCYGDKAAEVCQKLDLDGIVVPASGKKELASLRQKIGTQKVVGVFCSSTRHQAMIVSEAEPEFIAFDYSSDESFTEFLHWYNELFLIQSAVMIKDNIKNIETLDTDFAILNIADYKILVDKCERLD